ncbi:MAG: DNA repair protein RecN [Clostridia bacterium]|nr:DNA repair protein RecN [Clostridia bacterium]
MIKSIELKNIALIESAVIDFTDGLNVLSGETGSGKSVIIDSINFVLGAKADKTMIRFGEDQCSVSAVFDISDSPRVKEMLTEMDVEISDELIITRKFSVDSKNSIRVNGQPFTVGMLRDITSHLVDVHGQSEHYSLLKQSEQLKVLDKYVGEAINHLKDKISDCVTSLKAIDKSLSGFGGSESERAIRADILKFQIGEIESAELSSGEEEELISKRKLIQSAEKLSSSFSGAISALSGDDCAIDLVNKSLHDINQISSLDDKYFAISERLKSVSVELNDISATLEDYSSECSFDEADADRIENRLDKIKSIKKKYGIDIESVLSFLQNAKEEYSRLINFDEEYSKLIAEKKNYIDQLNKLYFELSDLRRKNAVKLCENVEKQLAELGMKGAKFSIDFEDLKEVSDSPYSENGADVIEFMFSANLGEPLKPMSKIISGGEMSRFMLALKVIIADYQDIKTYIFDEIDTGISGNIARIVAEKFADISLSVQVIAISHLPQICAMSDNSLLISKNEENGKTFTNVLKLNETQKISEVIRLIGGDVGSDAAQKHAEEMIEKANLFKKHL